MGQNKAVVVLN